MNREPVNPDDPQMTAYALGEMSAAESAEFEAKLQVSPTARHELESMREVMSLLGDGLQEEWRSQRERPALTLLAPVDSSVVISGNFRPAKRNTYAAAAAVAAMALVGAVALPQMKKGAAEAEGNGAITLAAMEGVTSSPVGSAPHIPQLFLAEEVEDVSSLDFVDDKGLSMALDASYLDAEHIVPAGFSPGQQALQRLDNDPVDSYLPPVGPIFSNRVPTAGIIERRLGGEAVRSTHASSVLVSGYVTMGGQSASEVPRVTAGFQPVSISGNPVVNEESDLRLLADLNGLRKDLSKVIAEMPQNTDERAHLERILERSERVVSQLKSEITH